jgi:predicted metal-binding membrane protein
MTERAVYIGGLAVFAAAAALTVYFQVAMGGGGMEMPGGWTMSMMWMVMPGQTWLTAALVFTVMWLAMMVAMMLPSVLPMLLLYRRVATSRNDRHVGRALWLLGGGYFFVWVGFGIVAYAGGMGLSFAAMHSRTISHVIPIASACALVASGAYQLTPWKSACLRHCRDPMGLVAGHIGAGARAALRFGLHHGVFCAGCCWALMVMQLVLGVMSIGIMIAVAAVIALEKLIARGLLIARVTGVAAIVAGAWMLVGALR